jgi:hypothetical protein
MVDESTITGPDSESAISEPVEYPTQQRRDESLTLDTIITHCPELTEKRLRDTPDEPVDILLGRGG